MNPTDWGFSKPNLVQIPASESRVEEEFALDLKLLQAPVATGAPDSTLAREPRAVPRKRADVVCLADVAPRTVRWLWEPRIPFGMLSMCSGDPGVGKSYLALALAADVTLGRLPGGRMVEPINVLYLTCENPIAECLRPRFDVLGGDAKRFFAVKGSVYEDENGEEERGSISLSDVALLEEAIVEKAARLVVVDPIQSYLGSSVDLHRSNETRPVMDGLAKLAEKHDCAFLLLRHLSKQSGGKAIHRGLGSIDLTGAVRSELLAGSLPDDPTTRALVHVKSNIGPYASALGYIIDGDAQGRARFTWTGESTVTAAELLAAPSEAGDKSALEDARNWLVDVLRAGSREQKEIERLAREASMKWATVRRAKEAMGIESRKTSMGGSWLWGLPEGAQNSTQGAHTEKMSTFASLSTFEDAQPPKMLNLSPLKIEDAQISTVSDEHLRNRGRLIV